ACFHAGPYAAGSRGRYRSASRCGDANGEGAGRSSEPRRRSPPRHVRHHDVRDGRGRANYRSAARRRTDDRRALGRLRAGGRRGRQVHRAGGEARATRRGVRARPGGAQAGGQGGDGRKLLPPRRSRANTIRRITGLTWPLGPPSMLRVMAHDGLLVGDLARKAGTTRKALRLYEAAGLLAPARRTSSGYRLYSQEALPLLAFILKARRIGFSV